MQGNKLTSVVGFQRYTFDHLSKHSESLGYRVLNLSGCGAKFTCVADVNWDALRGLLFTRGLFNPFPFPGSYESVKLM